MRQNNTSLQPVWDIPVRLGHWLMVLLFAVCWWSGENHEMTWHRYAGYGLLGIVLFRLYWGVVGTRTARLSNFVSSPKAALTYARNHIFKSNYDENRPEKAGHNPLGAWSVIALLGFILLQIGLGLFAVDVDGFDGGPLSDFVSYDTGRLCAEIHEISFGILMTLIVVHIAAIAYYKLVRKQNLVPAMIHGKAHISQSEAIKATPWLRVLVGAAVAALIVWIIAK